jgi:Predicted metal-dependent hydrolase with the TIM-barrel fold
MDDIPEHGDQHHQHGHDDDSTTRSGVSRRGLILGGGAAVVASALGGVLAGGPASAATPSGRPVAYAKPRENEAERDLLLINGKIHTMDDQASVVHAVRIQGNRIVAVGHEAQKAGGQAERIDLRGRTVVPGLIESHTHFISLANRPGYHVAQWELASNVDEVLAFLAARRPSVPEGQFITAMGAGTPNMFAERRLPTLAEIDAVINDRPVFLYQGGGGPARVNTLGKQFFESVSNPTVTVAEDGSLTGANANAALYHLRIRQTFEDKKRSALDAMAFSAQVGITTNLDQVLPPPNAWASGAFDPSLLEPQPNHALFQLNHYRMYDAWLALHAEGRAFVRLHINFLHNQGHIPALGELENQLPELRERLRTQFPNFGDDMVRTYGIGEWGAPFAAPSNPDGHAVWLEAQRLIARAGWRNENAQAGSPGNPANIEVVVAAYEQMEAEFGIKHLRWGLQHADHATPEQLARLKALGCGVSTSGFRWLNGQPRADGLPVGPLFPQLVDSGIPLGLHEDGVHIAPHNPWFALHYATTGLNVAGQQINPGQQISRQQALHLYTRGNAWYLGREHELGSIEPGKLADLVVLDKDYFTVSEAEMRTIRPIMTIVNGEIVHDTGVLGQRGR